MSPPDARVFSVLGLLIALPLAVLGGVLLYHGLTIPGEAERAKETPFLLMDVDLSRVGTYKGTIHHTFDLAHSTLLTLDVDPPIDDNALAPLKARCEMPADLGYSKEIYGGNRNWFGHAVGLTLCGVSMRKCGDIPFTFVVEKPVEALAGRRQRLIGVYDVCGMENVMAMSLDVVGFALLAAGLGIGIPLVIYVRRRVRRGAF